MKKNNLLAFGVSILSIISIVGCAPSTVPSVSEPTTQPSISEPTTQPSISEPTQPSISEPTQPEIETGVITDEIPQGTHYEIGDRVYNFTFKGVDGWDYDLETAVNSKYVVVINFFASWCSPCRAEFPAIEEAYREYSDKVEVLALSTEEKDTAAKLKNDFVNRYNLTFPMGIDSTLDIVYPYLTAKQVQGIDPIYVPYTVIIDRYGRFVEKITGSEPSAEAWKQKFEKYISEDYSF